MKLNITICNNFYNLSGVLNSDTSTLLEQEIYSAYTKFDKLTINIENLKSIDSKGLDVLAKLHYQAAKDQKEFSIIGLGCKEIYDHFESSEAA
ncbi:STAS domain-containing protein [Algibacter sp. 2305UL17-15]|uniref:STAS domain-containing protein n=1 Tax=Algibacter sp. 2305UL17-15 TaxID=3231268 RepID=UPI0034575E25